jgi:TonB family protein
MSQPAIDRRQTDHRTAPVRSILLFSVRLAVISLVLAASSLHAEDRAVAHKVPPTYPPIAKQLRITGLVTVVATVDSTGKVIKAESNSGNKVLAPAAIDAVKQWKFAPGDATSTIEVVINFSL